MGRKRKQRQVSESAAKAHEEIFGVDEYFVPVEDIRFYLHARSLPPEDRAGQLNYATSQAGKRYAHLRRTLEEKGVKFKIPPTYPELLILRDDVITDGVLRDLEE